MRVLVTGGAGYIGSHTSVELVDAGHEVEALDDLSTGHRQAIARASEICGREIPLHVGDLTDLAFVERVLDQGRFDAVVHFAAKKAVEESIRMPELYYHVNVGGTAALLRAMRKADVPRLVFSSTAAVYGDQPPPVKESAPTAPINPYGRSKLDCEGLIADACAAWGLGAISLRYFNPVGAHATARIGESPKDPTNLVPVLLQVIAGVRAEAVVFGDDWPTADGTCIRDYIHVVDLARAHIAAIEAADAGAHRIINVGRGHGHSVLEVIAAVERATGRPLAHRIGHRRAGDSGEVVADATLAQDVLQFRAEHDLDAMTASAYKWQTENPGGY